MQNIYFGAIFVAIVVYLLAAVLLCLCNVRMASDHEPYLPQ